MIQELQYQKLSVYGVSAMQVRNLECQNDRLLTIVS